MSSATLITIYTVSFFLCRKCGREIVQVSNVINVPSDMAISKRNDSLGPADRVMVQLFKNPQGAMFEVITTKEANVFRASEQVSGDTWWPGYNWIILGCPQCHQHVGWEYIPQNKNSDAKSFFGLVLSNLLYENEADELIVLPKSYQS
ncbi:protein cereblon-like isoform X2 [Dreissena polymorpha]|uniref:protein cereblon-like isoform X2 n=1 Tax=Dreissena polymorpha TaxID=45954 RepID=UPI002264C712|nr:protein cereblon-like isoform X2 [Dreissena polymorpha]